METATIFIFSGAVVLAITAVLSIIAFFAFKKSYKQLEESIKAEYE